MKTSKRKRQMTKKEYVRECVRQWIEGCGQHNASAHSLYRLETHHGVSLLKALDSMTHAQLATLLCVAVACSNKAHEEQREWRREYKETCAKDAARVSGGVS